MADQWTVQPGVSCPGCPHRAAYIACRKAMGRKADRIICGDAGCSEVGFLHPAATTCPGGEALLLDRYKTGVPAPAGDCGKTTCGVCVYLLPDEAMAAAEVPEELSSLAQEGSSVILGILASSRAFLTREALEGLGELALGLGCADAVIVDPFDSARCHEVLSRMIGEAGFHAVVFASPCAQLQHGPYEAEPAEIDRYACTSCHRCLQVTGCPAISFTPPVFSIDPDLCAGCDLCREHCRTHVIYSPRSRMTPEERSRARYTAVCQ